MLSRLELKELASHTLDGAHFVTLYLNLDPKQVKHAELPLHFKNLVRTLPTTDKAKVAPELNSIEKFLADHPTGLKRGLAVIACSERNFWWVYHSALPFKDDLVVKRDPFLKPLLLQLDQYSRYVVAVVGREEARLFIAGMGEMLEVTDFFRLANVDNPSRDGSRDGAWGGMGKIREQRKKEHTTRILNKDVAAAMEDLMKREEINRILLGGTDQSRGHFKEALPEALAHKVVAEFHVDKNAGIKEMLEIILPVMKDVEFNFERRALQELFEKSGKEAGGVIGLNPVGNALQQGNIRKMFLISDQLEKGMVCGKCSALTPVIVGPCPYCGGEMETVTHMYDLAIQKALDQGVRVDLIEHSPDLKKAGGIGALLRY